jgi:hypothetical protein
LNEQEAQVMRQWITSGQAATLRFTRDDGDEWLELLPIIDGRMQRATKEQGEDLQRLREAAQKQIAAEDFAAQRSREREEVRRMAVEARAAAELRAAATTRYQSATAPTEPDAPEAEPAPPTPRQQANEDLANARLCVKTAEKDLNHIREIEKTTGRPAPSSITFVAGQRVLDCRRLLQAALKHCKATKFC